MGKHLLAVLGSGLVHIGEGLPGWYPVSVLAFGTNSVGKNLLVPLGDVDSVGVLLVFIFYYKDVPNQDFIPTAITAPSFGQNPCILLQLPENTSPKENAFYSLFRVFLGKKTLTILLLHRNILLLSSIDQKPAKNASSGSRCQLIPKSVLRTWWQLTESSRESKCLAGSVQDYALSR